MAVKCLTRAVSTDRFMEETGALTKEVTVMSDSRPDGITLVAEIEAFREKIKTSRNLAKEADEFCAMLLKRFNGEDAPDPVERAEVLRIVDLILERPDARLRGDLETLRDLANTADRPLSGDTLLTLRQ